MLRPSIFHDSFRDNLFEDFFGDAYWPSPMLQNISAMNTDIRENEKEFLIDMELPGFNKEDIQAELKDGYMTITASHNEEKEEKNKKQKFIRKERFSGCYKRSFYVGEAVTEEDISAKFSDGVLTVAVPKKEKEPEIEQKKYICIEG